MEKVPFERVLGLDIGMVLQKLHESNGVQFVTEAIVEEFVKRDNIVESIRLKSGQVIPSEIVILGAGVVPATDFIPNDKITKDRDRSIVVDEYLYTGKDGLYAVGDLARFPWKYIAGRTVRIEHWGYSQTQGIIAGKNMVHGNIKKCDNIPFFWTTQYGKGVRYTGHALEYQRVIIDTSGEELNFGAPKFAAYYIHNGFAIAVATMSKDPIAAQFSELMGAGVLISETQLEEELRNTKTTNNLLTSLLSNISI